MIIVIGCADVKRAAHVVDAAPGSNRGDWLLFTLGEQFRHPHSQPARELLKLVISEAELIVLDFRQGRNGDSAALAHLLERPTVTLAKAAQETAQSRLILHKNLN